MKGDASDIRCSHMGFSLYTHGSVSVCRSYLGQDARTILETGALSEKGHATGVFPWYSL